MKSWVENWIDIYGHEASVRVQFKSDVASAEDLTVPDQSDRKLSMKLDRFITGRVFDRNQKLNETAIVS